MPETLCILCETNAHAKELYTSNFEEKDLNPTVFSARRLPDRLHETILRCTQCGLVYPQKLLDPEKLALLYESSTYTYADEEKHIRKTYSRYLHRALSCIAQQKKPWSYLDIGCGNGFMLSAAQDLGIDEARGIEPSIDAIAQAAENIRPLIFQGMFSAEIVGSQQFDVISCFQTLDHIPDPAGFVRQCFSVLKPGGVVLFINHNISSYTARILGERCPMIDIEHTFLHTPHTMRALFGRQGFTDIHTFSVRNDYPLHYWLHLLPAPSGLKKTLMKLLRTFRLEGVILPLYAGNLGLTARKAQSDSPRD